MSGALVNLVDASRLAEATSMSDKPKKRKVMVRSDASKVRLVRNLTGHKEDASEPKKKGRSHKEIRKAMYGKEE